MEKPEEQFNKPPENPEQELSPEVLEKVMEKVIDVCTSGLAIKSISSEKNKLVSFLKMGLIGSSYYPDQVALSRETDNLMSSEMNFLNKYKRELSNRKIKHIDSPVFFNIMGRSLNYNSSEREPIQHLYETAQTSRNQRPFGIIFDLKRFKEVAPSGEDNVGGTKNIPFDSFCVDDISLVYSVIKFLKRKGITETEARSMLAPKSEFLKSEEAIKEGFSTREGLLKSSSEYGFFLNGRVAPRDFRGFFVSLNADEVLKTQLSIYGSDPDQLLPIYDIDGNLLWPKQMNYEEVKKFAAERKLKEGKK